MVKVKPNASDEWPVFDPHEHGGFTDNDWQSRMWLRPDIASTEYNARIHYVLTIDGYAYARDVWGEEALEGGSGHRLDAATPEAIRQMPFVELRALLFLAQRAIKWSEGSEHPREGHALFDRLYSATCCAWTKEKEKRRSDIQKTYDFFNSDTKHGTPEEVHRMTQQSAGLSLAKHTKIALKQLPQFSEAWLHDQICKDTTMLGLGDLNVIDRERVQISGGRLDILMADNDDSIRYEVEIMLGATDPSHIIRCIEYWDIERRRYPAYDHVAVLVAEEVTTRFLNVMALLAGSIPLIAIQLNALQVGNQIVLDFVKVLDQRVLREDDTIDIGGDDVDRSTWEAKVGAATMLICDRITQIANEIAEPKLELKYKKGHMALSTPGAFFNVLPLYPKKAFVRLRFKTADAERWVQQLSDSGLDAYMKKAGRVLVRLKESDFNDNEDIIRDVIHLAVKEHQA